MRKTKISRAKSILSRKTVQVDSRTYRQSTIDRIQDVLVKGEDKPKYALYARQGDGEPVLVAVTASKDDALLLRRKARGFARRVLRQAYRFKIAKAS
jgi:hypothetical protein